MKRWRSKAALAGLLLGGAASLAIGLPAFGQDSPESLLPPGFGDPAPARDDRPAAPQGPTAAPAPSLLPGGFAGQPAAPVPSTVPAAAPAATAPKDDAPPPEPFELPPESRRPVDIVGVLGPAETGFDQGGFGNANGLFVSTLMRRLNAPFASRWASILLRRALLTRQPAPRGVEPADWVAERAWLLLRMGEADGARLLVQSVDTDRYTPRLTAVAAQVALATADLTALCPLAEIGEGYSGKEPIWPLAQAMCSALSGEAGVAGALIDRSRRNRNVEAIDVLLAEKVVGAGAGGRRAINIEWEGVERLTAWRFGLASALNVTIPDTLLAKAPHHVRAWQARAPITPLAVRSEAALTAAALGVFSNAALVDLYGALADETDSAAISDSPAGRLRVAYIGEDDAAKLSALRTLWGTDTGGWRRYGLEVLTARAAALIGPSADHAGDAAKLIAAMFSAGLDTQAARWSAVVQEMSAADADPAWAMLAVGLPRPDVDLSLGRVESFAGRVGTHKGRMLFAALAGLGRLSERDVARGAESLEVSIAREDRWTRALDLAANSGQPATVALLAATGLQAPDWRGIPPEHLYRVLTALRRVGREGEARMIAAEAMARL